MRGDIKTIGWGDKSSLPVENDPVRREAVVCRVVASPIREVLMGFLQHLDGLHAIAGLLVGLLVGLTGVGGGSLMTPVLVLLFGVNPTTAVGTDLLYASATKTVGTAVHGWRATVDWQIMRRLAAGSLPAAGITLVVLSRLGAVSPHTQKVMVVALACMLLLTALTVFFQKPLLAYARRDKGDRAESRPLWPTVLLGALIGVAVSLTSVGAGAIGVTVLLVLYPKQPIAKIVGTDIAHAVPLTLLAGLGHWIIGDVNPVLLANLLSGSIPGVVVGSLIATRARDSALRVLLGSVLAISAWQLYLKATSADKVKAKPEAAATVAQRAS